MTQFVSRITLQNHATATFTKSLRVLRMTKVLRTSRVVLLFFWNKNNGLRRITVFCFHIDDSRDLFVFLQCPAATVSLAQAPISLSLPSYTVSYFLFLHRKYFFGRDHDNYCFSVSFLFMTFLCNIWQVF